MDHRAVDEPTALRLLKLLLWGGLAAIIVIALPRPVVFGLLGVHVAYFFWIWVYGVLAPNQRDRHALGWMAVGLVAVVGLLLLIGRQPEPEPEPEPDQEQTPAETMPADEPVGAITG